MAWLRNRKTGGWFEIPDDEVTKDKQIAQNKQIADKLNAKSDNRADETTQKIHQMAIRELDDKKYETGTYDISTKQIKEFDDGYQVTFCQIGDNYTDKEYADRVNELLSISSDGKVYAGKFEGTPEVSFHCNSKEEAIRIVKKYNQISIWDWKEGNKDWRKGEIKTGGTGRRK